MSIRRNTAIACLFCWAGFVAAISFMEAWLKFRAPGVTLPIGLGIGRLVFAALNKVEWTFAVIAAAYCIWKKPAQLFYGQRLYFIVACVILLLQTFWLLPALDARAEYFIHGQEPPRSYLHLIYFISEMIKVTSLMVAGIRLLHVSVPA